MNTTALFAEIQLMSEASWVLACACIFGIMLLIHLVTVYRYSKFKEHTHRALEHLLQLCVFDDKEVQKIICNQMDGLKRAKGIDPLTKTYLMAVLVQKKRVPSYDRTLEEIYRWICENKSPQMPLHFLLMWHEYSFVCLNSTLSESSRLELFDTVLGNIERNTPSSELTVPMYALASLAHARLLFRLKNDSPRFFGACLHAKRVLSFQKEVEDLELRTHQSTA